MRVMAHRSSLVGWRRSPLCQSTTSVPQPLVVLKVSPLARSRSSVPSRDPSQNVARRLRQRARHEVGREAHDTGRAVHLRAVLRRMSSAFGEPNLTPVRSSTRSTASLYRSSFAAS